MKTIRFLERCVKRDLRVGTPQEESYMVGQIITLADDQAYRWIRRNKAVEAPLQAEPVVPVEPQTPFHSDPSPAALTAYSEAAGEEEPVEEKPPPRRYRRAKDDE